MYDVIVIGAGIEGSATAYDLIKRPSKPKVLLIEQYSLLHNRGSSHGETRITRRAYPEHYYTEMMTYATEQWKVLSERAGEQLFNPVNYLCVGQENGKFLQDNIDAMEMNAAPFRKLSSKQLASDFPMLKYPDNWGGVLDLHGGILYADKCLKAVQRFFVEEGGIIKDKERYEGLVPGEVIQVKTNKGSYQCKSIVFACGSWANKCLSTVGIKLPLKPEIVTVCFWPEKIPGTHTLDKFPTFFDYKCCDGLSVYGLGTSEYPGHVKLCIHGGPEVDPDSRASENYQYTIDLMADYISKHFPGLVAKPSYVDTCIYTLTPDCDLILDRHPKWRNIVFGAGFSGHGFKLSPTVGQILGDLALDVPCKYDLSHFRMSRFPQTGESKL